MGDDFLFLMFALVRAGHGPPIRWAVPILGGFSDSFQLKNVALFVGNLFFQGESRL